MSRPSRAASVVLAHGAGSGPWEGAVDPEEVYGRVPPGVPARPESLLARAERKRGVSVAAIPCPSLVIYGDDYRIERGRAVADLYASEGLHFPGLDHWGLVLSPEVAALVVSFLASGAAPEDLPRARAPGREIS